MNTMRYCVDCQGAREVRERMCPTCGHHHEACTECCGDQLWIMASVRADGTLRMTDAQRDTLWRKCGDYNVPFREDDYTRQSDLPAGYVAGWIGGWPPKPKGSRTIYVGVSPTGEVSS